MQRRGQNLEDSSLNAELPSSAAPAEHTGFAANVLAGLVVASVMAAYSFSMAALIFSGPLSSALPFGIFMIFSSAALCCLIVPFLSSQPIAVAAPDTPVVAVLSALAFQVVMSVGPSGTSDDAVIAAVLAVILMATVATGLFLWVGSILKLGQALRFIPYPVIGGFLLASGWFLISGAVRVITRDQVGLLDSLTQLNADQLSILACAIAIGVALGLGRYLSKSPFVLPGLLILAVFGSIALTGREILNDAASSWFLSFPAASENEFIWPFVLDNVPQWQILLPFLPEALVVAGIASITILLNATGLEMAERKIVDVDREFRASGLANLAVAFIGGAPANLSMNRTRLAYSAGATNRIATIVCAAAVGFFLFFGNAFVAAIPTPILSGMLMFMGGSLLWDWLVSVRRKMSRTDYALMLTIWALIVNFGFLEGAAMGTVAACVSFAVNYARIPFIREESTRCDTSSYVQRPREHSRLLQDFGKQILVLRLQGYLFFGTSNRLFEHLRAQIENAAEDRIHWLVIDFSFVPGIDSSAGFSLVKLQQLAEQQDIKLVFTGIHPGVRRKMRAEDLFSGQFGVREFVALDPGLEHCENELLERHAVFEDAASNFETWMTKELGSEEAAQNLSNYVRACPSTSGTYLAKQDEESDDIFFVVAGQVSVYLERDGELPVRLRTMLGRTLVGEMGFFTGDKRSASIVLDQDTSVYMITRKQFQTLENEDPRTATRLYAYIVRTLSERLSFSNRELAHLH